jgi:hypothetical protein
MMILYEVIINAYANVVIAWKYFPDYLRTLWLFVKVKLTRRKREFIVSYEAEASIMRSDGSDLIHCMHQGLHTFQNIVVQRS